MATACDPGGEYEAEYEAELEARVLVNGWGCRKCGYTNSPVFGQHPIDSFADGNGSADAPLELEALEDPAGARHPAQVEGEEFVASTPGGPVYGLGLSGWHLVFTDGKNELSVRISNVGYHPDWVDGQPIATYGLDYIDPTDPETTLNVCPGLPLDDTTVLLLAGEQYDTVAKTVVPDQPGWVTMACRGHALAKMKLLGYGPSDIYGSQWEQRQSTLKMITADYCGDGSSFTQVGQPLEWIDQLGHFGEEDLSGPAQVEAIWSENGAVCLNEPRLVSRATVENLCTIPSCPEGNDPGNDHWMSLLPIP